MTGPATGTATALTGVAAAMAFIPSDVPASIIAFGAVAFFGGCSCRTGIALFRKLDSVDPLTLPWFARQFAMLFCCVPLAIVASAIVFLAALTLGSDVTKDAPPLWGLLLILGIRGPEGFQWLASQSSNIFMRFVPAQKPGGGTP